MQWRKFTRLKKSATGNSRCKAMLCCGRRKDNGRSVPDLTASPGRAPHHHQGPMMMQNQHGGGNMQRQNVKEPVLLQGDFRKVSGISSEIFRQIESVENDHDPSTASALEAVERRGEMIVRILEPRCIGSRQSYESAQRFLSKADSRHTVQMVEIVKRPGQTLGLYIREGNGADRSDGVFISRIALESAVYNSGCLRVSDEILAVNLVDVTKMSLDDVVIIMSIPRRLVLAIRTRRGRSNSPPPLARPEQKPPVVVIKRDLRDDCDMIMDEGDHAPRQRTNRERITGDGREMSESRSRLGLGLTNYSPQSEQLDLYYNTRSNPIDQHTPSWNYKPPAPPSTGVITEQPKGAHQFQPSHAYYQNAGTLESLAEKVHSFYPGPSRRMSDTRAGVSMSQSHQRFPRSGSADILPRVEYTDYSASLGRHSLLRSSLKSSGGVSSPHQQISGGTLGRYGRYDQSSRNAIKYSSPTSSGLVRQKPQLDYSSDTEATINRPNYYYYNKQNIATLGRPGATIANAADFAKFNSLPRDRNLAASARLNLRSRMVDRIGSEDDGNLSAPEYTLPAVRRDRDLRSRMTTNPSIFTSDEYRAWLRRAPSSSAICEQMRASRDILNQQRAHRFSCSAENIHDALKNPEAFSHRARMLGTLDRNSIGLGTGRTGLASLPVRSLSSQHIGGPSSAIRSSPNIRRMRQLLELTTGANGGIQSPSGSISGHQSPAPTPSTTLPRTHRQIDINPAEFTKYKLDKPIMENHGISGMLWLNLLAGRGLRVTPENVQGNVQVRDLYCVIECDRVHKARTVVRSGDLQFDWDESFELDLVNNKQLDVLIYSWDPQHRHKLCYRGTLAITSLLRAAPIHQLALKVEPRGTIYLRIRYNDPQQLYRRRGVPALRGGISTGLFGVDLETIVTREAKGAPGNAPVPIVLRRCVEEIERRGLDIIGLYRLCGSATKKRLLREAFERNSRAVELTPEHVPDINVITGVIKDYLRELPEPLFTRCLFQMTVDALGVCLPDDPEGNAKLMLSILDCLPRANRATLVFLLDHLSLVVSASERNKMSAQALATALGPPLMLHSASCAPNEEIDHAQPIAVLKYLLQIWPQPASANAVSGIHRHASEQRIGTHGNKVFQSQVGKQPLVIINNTPSSHARTQLSVSNHQSPSVVAQLAQSHRVSQPVAQTSQQASSVSLVVQDPSQHHPATPSPSSSSSGSCDSNSGTETIKRGASPPENIYPENTSSPPNKPERAEKNLSVLNGNKQQQSHDQSAQKSTDETKKEENTCGPSHTSSDEKLLKTSSNKTSTPALTSSAYDNYKTHKTYTTAANLSLTPPSLENKTENLSERKADEIPLYKPTNYLDNTTSVSTTKASATMVKHKITNNFKLPPFPVYIPSTTFSSSTLNLHSSTDPGSNNEASNKNTDTCIQTSSVNSTSTSHLSSVSSTTSSSGFDATINACSTSTLSLGRVNPYLYQTESSLSNNSNNVTMITTITSSNINNEKTASYTSPFLDQKSSYNNVCSSATMSKVSSEDDSYISKLSHGIAEKDTSYSYKYNTEYYSNITTTNNSSLNGTSTYTSASDNIYRVQYSATNPFLDPLDSTGSSQTESNGLTSIFSKATATARSGASSMVSEIAKKFEKLDFEDDLK